MKLKNIFLIIILGFLLTSCQKQENQTNKINIIVSILPQIEFVEKIGGDYVKVNELIPNGASPATYEPKPSDLKLIEKADIYFRIGHIPFEKSHLNKIKSLNQNLLVIDTSKNANLRYFNEDENHEHEEETEHHENEKNIDPHIWLSPTEVKKQIDIITNTLSEIDPTNKEYYEQNAQNYKKELDNLDTEIKSSFNNLKTNKFMVFHPSWGYFARDYNLEQIPIENSGKEPTSKELQELINYAKQENIKVIFVQAQFNQEIAKSLSQEINGTIISIDPLAKNYIENLKNISEKIKSNLNKE